MGGGNDPVGAPAGGMFGGDPIGGVPGVPPVGSSSVYKNCLNFISYLYNFWKN